MSSFLSTAQDFFSLDIGSSAVRLVQLRGSGATKSLVKYSYVPLDGNIALSDSSVDQAKLAETIKQLVAKTGVSTKNVAVGIPSSRVFTTIADVEKLSPKEMKKSIELQADSLIPTPIAESKVDWAVIGDSPSDKTKQEILLTSVPNKYIENRLEMLESIGLNVIAFEPDNLALARALSTVDAKTQLILDIGRMSSDLVIMTAGIPHLTRSIPTGIEAIVRSTAENMNIDAKQAEQLVFKFGMSKDKLEGQVFQAVSGAIEQLTTEIEKSIKFYQTRYVSSKVDNIIVSGGAAAVPELPLHFANKFGVNVEVGNAWRNVAYGQERQNELLSLSSQFGVAVGLAERAT